MVNTRNILALLALAAAGSFPVAAQQESEDALFVWVMSHTLGRDGATPYYSGAVYWTNQEGDGIESVSAYVTRGKVACKGTFRDANGVRDIDGPGLMEMSLGLGGDKYSFIVACPNATGDPVQPAGFNHSRDSYKQPGGKVVLRDNRARLPRVLQGSWSEPYEDGGSIRMIWKLCTYDCPLPPNQAPPVLPGPP